MTHLARAFASAAVLAFTSVSTPALAGPVNAWDGVWKGKADDAISVVVRIADGKAVAYYVKDTRIDIKFSHVANDVIEFGDPDHYIFKLKLTGDSRMLAKYRDRDGWSRLKLDRAQG